MSRTADSARRRAPPRGAPISSRRVPPCSPPLTWTFDGPFAVCLTDIEDTLRRAIVQLGDISDVAIAIDLSLPALAARVAAGGCSPTRMESLPDPGVAALRLAVPAARPASQ